MKLKINLLKNYNCFLMEIFLRIKQRLQIVLKKNLIYKKRQKYQKYQNFFKNLDEKK